MFQSSHFLRVMGCYNSPVTVAIDRRTTK